MKLFVISSLLAFALAANAPTSWDDASANKALDSICSASNPSITACSLRQYCKGNSTLTTNDYCSPASLLADVCIVDKKDDPNCKAFVSACQPANGANSTDAFCAKAKSVPSLPSTSDYTKALSTICGHHQMPSCDKAVCKLSPAPAANQAYDCDQMTQLREICIDMDTMDECSGWKKMCSASNNFAPLCTPVQLSKDNSSKPSNSSKSSDSISAFSSTVSSFSIPLVILGFLST